MFLVFSFLVNRNHCAKFPPSWNGAWVPGFIKKIQKVIIRQQICFLRAFFKISFLTSLQFFLCGVLLCSPLSTCGRNSLRLSLVSDARSVTQRLPVASLGYLRKQIGESPEFCSVHFHTERCVFSCNAVLVWWSLCRMNSALALLWFSTFASVGSCSWASLAWLTASCISCSWLVGIDPTPYLK